MRAEKGPQEGASDYARNGTEMIEGSRIPAVACLPGLTLYRRWAGVNPRCNLGCRVGIICQ
jgi:hypothetical protein